MVYINYVLAISSLSFDDCELWVRQNGLNDKNASRTLNLYFLALIPVSLLIFDLSYNSLVKAEPWCVKLLTCEMMEVYHPLIFPQILAKCCNVMLGYAFFINAMPLREYRALIQRPSTLQYDPKLNSHHISVVSFLTTFFTKKEYHRNEDSSLSNLVHFDLLLYTFMQFSYTLIRFS